MKDKITFEEIYEAYILCLKNKKNKVGTYNFVNCDICKNLIVLLFIENRELKRIIYIKYLKETKDRGDKDERKNNYFNSGW